MFSFVQAAVGQVLKTIMDQVNFVEEILSEIQGYGPGIGSAWQGEDADAFVQEINSRLVPQVTAAIASIGGMHAGISRAVEAVMSAEQKAHSYVSDVRGIIDKIC
jgi:hypothetical protein